MKANTVGRQLQVVASEGSSPEAVSRSSTYRMGKPLTEKIIALLEFNYPTLSVLRGIKQCP